MVFLVSQERNGECQSYSARFVVVLAAIQLSIDEPEFSYEDFARKICLAGTWNGKVSTMHVVVSNLRTAGFRFSILTVSVDEK